VRSTWVRMGWLVLFLCAAVGGAVSASSLFGTTYNLGDEVRFEVESSTTWWWGCCCCSCEDSLIQGWRVVDRCQQVVYSVMHDAPVSSSFWQGSWMQLDMNGMAVPAGEYKLIVDTSVGTLSRCFTIRDPCASNWCNNCNWPCTTPCTTWCVCEEVPSITDCSCKTSLLFVRDCQTGCFPFFWWGCNSCSSSSSCSSCP
jgi:hypothetical protein